MTEITSDFTEPFSNVGSSLSSTFSPSVVGIAGVPYLMDNSSNDYKRESFSVVQQRNTNDSRDLLLLPQDVWRQQVQSWHQGSGQSNMDRDNTLEYRYNDSFGIDPWTEWQINLLPKTSLLGADTYTGQSWLTTSGNYLVLANADSLYWYATLSDSAVPTTQVVVASDNIIDISDSGPIVTTLHASGKVNTISTISATPTLFATFAGANFIEWVKDHLILCQANKIYDITAGGAGVLIYTHPDVNFRWNAAAAGNSCIYLSGGVSGSSVVHRVTIKEDGTGLNPAIVAATLPDGENAHSVATYLGFVFIGTDKGVRMAQAATSGDLTLGSVIPTTTPVTCFEGHDRFIWYGNNAITSTYADGDPYFPVGTVTGLSRMDLSSTTINNLTPAYATDINAIGVTGGVVNSVTTFGDKRVFTINGAGAYYEKDELMDSGWLTQGIMSFSVEDLKTGLYTQSKWNPLKGEVQIDLSYDSAGYARVASFSIQDSIRSGNISINGTQFSRVQPRYLLNRSATDNTLGPELTRWEIRVIPVKGRASRWTLPIINHEEVEIDSVIYTRDTLVTLDNLVNLVQTSSLFTLQVSGASYQAHAKNFMWEPQTLTQNGKAWQGILTLTVEEVQ